MRAIAGRMDSLSAFRRLLAASHDVGSLYFGRGVATVSTISRQPRAIAPYSAILAPNFVFCLAAYVNLQAQKKPEITVRTLLNAPRKNHHPPPHNRRIRKIRPPDFH